MLLSSLLAEITYESTSSGVSASGSLSGGGAVALFVGLAIYLVLLIAGFWKTLAKGGEAGPMSLLMIVTCLAPLAWLPMMKLIGRPAWWVVLLYIPIVNIVVLAIVSIDVAKAYGKSTGFGIGLWLLAFIFYPILGFGSATYQGPSVKAA